MKEYQRKIVETLSRRMGEPRRFMQILIGPRQTGKTTAIRQALGHVEVPYHYAEVPDRAQTGDWIRAHWQRARNLIRSKGAAALLVIDEVQLVRGWSDTVKALWDEDAWNGVDLRVVLTGSSATLLRTGLGDSLAGRFELIRCTHWTYAECREAFGYSLDDFLLFGGYPGAASLRGEGDRWLAYLQDAIIDASIDNDVVAMEQVRNPALLRRLFYLGAPYSAQEVSYRKLLGQLDDRGNTATIAHYLGLLEVAGLMSGLHKYDPKLLRRRASSPRLLVHDTALMTAACGSGREGLLTDASARGHLVESAVGAYLLARAATDGFEVCWWREGSKEVDFVVSDGRHVTAIEVKSGRVKSTGGLEAFCLEYPEARTLVVGSAACGVGDFLMGDVGLLP